MGNKSCGYRECRSNKLRRVDVRVDHDHETVEHGNVEKKSCKSDSDVPISIDTDSLGHIDTLPRAEGGSLLS